MFLFKNKNCSRATGLFVNIESNEKENTLETVYAIREQMHRSVQQSRIPFEFADERIYCTF